MSKTYSHSIKSPYFLNITNDGFYAAVGSKSQNIKLFKLDTLKKMHVIEAHKNK